MRRSLSGLPIPEIRSFDSIGSTNDEAMAWAETGAPDGALVTADTQTAGRGRLGRRWVTQPGTALAFSLVLHPGPEEIEHLGLISPLGALAVCSALEEGYGLCPRIKWPNDVLLEGRKLCGILLEADWQADFLRALVIGIGVNVLAGSLPPAGEVRFPATCLETVLGHAVDREDLLRRVLVAFFEWRGKLGTARFLQAWEERLAFKGQAVSIENAGGPPVTGMVVGVDPSGDLCLRVDGGEEIKVKAGDVRLRPVE